MRAATWTQPSPLGPLVLTTSASGLRSVGLPGSPASAGAAAERPVDEVSAAFEAYFAGDLDALHGVPVDLGGRTAFSLAILTALRDVRGGGLTSYGRLGAAAGRPLAGRAVGRAVGANPLPVVVPCHRVVAGDGSLGGFSGGLPAKRWLLAHEGHAWAAGDVGATRRREPVRS